MCKLLELSLRLRNKKWWFSRVLGNILIQIPVLYSKWIEFSIRKFNFQISVKINCPDCVGANLISMGAGSGSYCGFL